jgi:glycosyltransferase involved in cell wall biosynthesis
MMTPLVSIVLPTYNGSRYLDDSLRSCLAQTHTNWELIIVDDCSTDDTPLRIAKYVSADSRIQSVRHETNRKLPAALNTGFRIARGDFLTWTSDDNYYHHEALQSMLSFLENHPEAGMVYSDWTMIDENDGSAKPMVVGDPNDLIIENRIGPCFLYRRQVKEIIGNYADDLFLAEDYDYWLRVSRYFRLLPLHRNLYYYRCHRMSLKSQHQDRIARIADAVSIRNLPSLKWVSSSRKSEAFLELAGRARRRQEPKAVFVNLFRALLYSPPNFAKFAKHRISCRISHLL